MKVMIVQIGKDLYAISIEEVHSIESMLPLRSLPWQTVAQLGVTDVRSQVIPVYDLRVALGVEPVRVLAECQIVVVGLQGFVVDAAIDIAECSLADWQQVGSHKVWRNQAGLIAWLDVARLAL